MDKVYADTVRLMLSVVPDVFVGGKFAMKGGTAINLFVRDKPRLSVDIDVVYTTWQIPRDQALADIAAELGRVETRVTKLGLKTRRIAAKDMGDTKLLIDDGNSQVLVEVNTVFRGTVLPVEKRPLSARTAEMFSVELEAPILSAAELYGSKLVAAMDRQHPRDLFDAWQMFEADGLSDTAVECFVTYLAGHNRPTHEVLFSRDKDIAAEYRDNFVGMTTEEVALETLLETRIRLRGELIRRLTERHKQFLIGLARAEPDWSLLACPHAAELPGLRWKLSNLQKFSEKRPGDFRKQAEVLESRLREGPA